MKKDIYRKRLFIFLFVYFALFSSYYMTDTFTKCVGQLNKDAATSIAKWDVSLASTSLNSIDVIRGNTTDNLEGQTYSIDVTCESDVGVNYSIVLGNIPTGVRVVLDGTDTYYENNNVITISNAGSFDVGDLDSTHTHSLTFIAPEGTATVLNNSVTVDVSFVQKNLQ